MGKITGGPGLNFSGTIDGITYSRQKDGSVHTKKKNRPTTTAPTLKQLVQRQKTSVINQFMAPLKEFVKIGYALEGTLKRCNEYNAMASYIRADGLTGMYPFQRIDFSRILMTRGQMEAPAEVTVYPAASGVTFKWSPEMKVRGSHYSDQVIMLAYFAELHKIRFISAGAQRHKGEDVLELTGMKKGYTAELFIAFVANDRDSISDSVYAGQIKW